jgi:hypothetical protein
MSSKPVNTLMVYMVLIIREIILKNKQQNNTYRNAQCKSKYIEDGKEFVFEKNSDRKFQMGKKHVV